ncbi:MAG: hypothetical protein JWO22_4148 [Frankiales bacterium]|nr:hypothetical protein [Frankiales bacterium]
MLNPRRVLLAAAASLALLSGTSSAGVTDPLNGPYPQVHGEMVTGIPATRACTVTVVKDFRFHNTAYGSDAPFTGDYVPSCSGPWAKVVMTMSATVRTGTQFDRIGDVLVGGVTLLHLTTPEGESGETDWSIQRDVTDYASVLSSRQPTYFIIGNQTDGTYTGDFYGTLSFTFYATGARAPAAVAPDAVLGLSPGVDKGLPTRSGGKPLTSSVTVPRNTTALTGEVFASGHGAEEEDWWNAPFACASGGIPYREVSISVDGRLAGIAPVYPTLYTGGYGPDFWRPIPSPRALDLRPYRFDLTPFVGELTDDASHRIDIAVLGQGGCDGYWFLGGNLLVTTNHQDEGRTQGALVSSTGAAQPDSTTLGVQGDSLSDRTTSAHRLVTEGWLRPPGGSRTDVTVVQDMTNDAVDAALDVRATWTWTSSTTRSDGGRSSQSSAYSLLRTGPTWTLTDDQDTSTTSAGSTVTSSLRDTMSTGGPVVGITGVLGASHESWVFSTSTGTCVDHELAAAVQNTVYDKVSDSCTALPLRV